MSPFISFVLAIFMKEGFGMKRVVLLAAVAVFSVLGLVTAEFAAAADAPAGPTGPADQMLGESSRTRVMRRRPRHSRVVCGHNGPIIQTANSSSASNTGTPVNRPPGRL